MGTMATLAVLTLAAGASADEPDIRNIQPFVMVIVDSSASMEYLPNCDCVTAGCSECIPNCGLIDDSTGRKKNRWATLLETLTGKFDNFQCNALARTAANGMTYDLNIGLPYHQPWACASGSVCNYPGTSTQQPNGLLDNYLSRLRFGLMTFDGKPTYGRELDLIYRDVFTLPQNIALSETAPGSWSYGGPKPIHFPTCTQDYLEDTGVRGPNATEGGLISISGSGCTTPPCDTAQTNAAIQKSLLSTRTFGGTPIAASLDDLYYHFKKNAADGVDPFASCRSRYAVLITDGTPDDDYRKFPTPGCDCVKLGDCPVGTVAADMKCPYPEASQAAYNLIHGRDGEPAQMKQLFVVGMSINSTKAKTLLNTVASSGGSVDTDGDGNEAFFANDPATLTSMLDSVFAGLSKPVSRSIPAFATGLNGAQYQVSAGFQVSNAVPVAGVATPWNGILERRRFVCDSSHALSSETLDSSQGDMFHEVLNKQTSRLLWTALPTSGTIDTARLKGALYRAATGADCGTTYCAQPELTDSSITPQLLGVADAAAKTRLNDWMYGVAGSVRAGKRLGDIYHSSPTIVGPPTDDPGDDSYTLFRDSAVITERPQVVYIGSNDGILHAFSLAVYPGTGVTLTVHPSASYKAGEEMWGFVPPLLINKLKDQIPAHQMSMDGTPVVKDVFYSKHGTAAAADYHTVLITGMRGGGNAYMALDVTDPVRPKFLWQFTDADMGQTYGQAEIVQATYAWPLGTTPTLRAMAILPGGVGSKGNGPGCNISTGLTNTMDVVSATGTKYKTLPDTNGGTPKLEHRPHVPCWNQKGRALYFVDIETGQQIKKIFDNDTSLTNGTVFASPLSGSPTAYQDAVGTVATEGFVMDADGVLWRIDLTATDPRPNDAFLGWTVRPFHDLFWDQKSDVDATKGETTYERPILSLDEQHRLVIITGTGDTDNFEKPLAENRVVSLTEVQLTTTPSGADDYTAALNWEQRVDKGNGFEVSELVTGSMALFQGQLYVASFISVANNSNACDVGRGRLWAFDYHTRDDADPNGTLGTFGPKWLTTPTGGVTNGADSGANLFNVTVANAEPNLLIQGLGATQRLTCQTSSSNLSNYFASGGGLTEIQQSAPPAVWIVAQASGNNATRNRAGSMLGSLEVKVNRPLAFSRVISWAGSID
jgi:type IV pilus assembly protein PilY1